MSFLRYAAGSILAIGVPLIPTVYILLWLGPTTFWQSLASLIFMIPFYLICLVTWLMIMAIIKFIW